LLLNLVFAVLLKAFVELKALVEAELVESVPSTLFLNSSF